MISRAMGGFLQYQGLTETCAQNQSILRIIWMLVSR